METAQIISTLREKVGQTSLSERTFQEYVNAVNPQTEPDDAFWAQHVAILKSMSGQYNHDIAEWQKAHPQPSPAAGGGENNGNNGGGAQPSMAAGISPEVQALIDAQKKSIEDLTALVTGQQKKMTHEAIRNAATTAGDTLKVNNKNLWADAVSRTVITEGMTQEQFNATVKQTYEANLKAFIGDGVQPYGTAAPADPSAQINSQLDAFFANKPGFEKKA